MEWIKGSFGFEEARVGKAVLSVGWDTTGPKVKSLSGYVATVDISSRRTKRLESRDQAKTVIEALLRETCEQILEEMDKPPEEVKSK